MWGFEVAPSRVQGLKKKLRKYATQCRPFYLPDLYTASVISPQARLHKFIHLGHTLRRSAFDSQVRAKHKDELSNIVKAQATTTKRTAVTVEQQYRWHMVRAPPPPLFAVCPLPSLSALSVVLKPVSLSLLLAVPSVCADSGRGVQVPARAKLGRHARRPHVWRGHGSLRDWGG